MLDFLRENYQLLILAFVSLVDLVLFLFALCKKKVDPSINTIIARLPSFICLAEQKLGAGMGKEKKQFVLEMACSLYKTLTGLAIEEGSSIYSIFSGAIETILSTPIKKGVK